MTSLDWDSITRLARRLTPVGPKMTLAEATAVAQDLRDCAVQAPALISEVSLLPQASSASIAIVDRLGWVDQFARSTPNLIGKDALPNLGIFATLLGVPQIGAVVAFLSGRILGQYDPFADTPRLLLIAPNIVKIGRKIGHDSRDFRMWVCLHEQTHQAQFAAAPWLADRIRELAATLFSVGDEPNFAQIRSLGTGVDSQSLRKVFGEEIGQAFDDVTSLMSVLEGHAEFMMDEVGPSVIPQLDSIRHGFTQHRRRGGVSALMTKLLGLGVKARQYQVGVAFVRAVINEVGVAGFNQVFSGPDAMPTIDELEAPATWVERIHGSSRSE